MDTVRRFTLLLALLLICTSTKAVDNISKHGPIFGGQCKRSWVWGIGFLKWVEKCQEQFGPTVGNSYSCGKTYDSFTWGAYIMGITNNSFKYGYDLITKSTYEYQNPFCSPSTTTQTGIGTGTYLDGYYCGSDDDPAPTFYPGPTECGQSQSLPRFSTPNPGNCPPTFGDPIDPISGRMLESVDLGVRFAGRKLAINYDSMRAVAQSQMGVVRKLPAFGHSWFANWLPSLYRNDRTQPQGYQVIQGFSGSGRMENYSGPGTLSVGEKYTSISTKGDAVFRTSDYGLMRSVETLNGEMSVYEQSIDGHYTPKKLQDVAAPAVQFKNSTTGLPTEIGDSFGRTIYISYNTIPAGGGPFYDAKIVNMKLSDGTSIAFDYSDDGDLVKITWQDGKAIRFLYEQAIGGLKLLTGMVDENDTRVSTFTYNQQGMAISTEQAGGVNRYQANHDTPPQLTPQQTFDNSFGFPGNVWRYEISPPSGTTLTTPNGSTLTLKSATRNGNVVSTEFSQPAGSGCVATTRAQDFDTDGNLAWREDFNGRRTCYATNADRSLETSRVEGLPTGFACSGVLPDGASLPAGSRKVSTAWHPVWRKATKVAEPRRMTTSVFNGQPDPFNGGTMASCAPASAVLDDGSPIVVLCKQVEQATTDLDGSKGLAATVDSSVAPRIQQWTYNEYGQVLTYKDPLDHTTTNAYYADTTADHTRGDLSTVTNAKGHAVSYTKYNPNGQWLEMKDANGITTTRTFDLRQRLKSVKTGNALTSYDYWPTGLLQKVTLPDSSSLSYGYDDAHRLTSIADNLGNSITYTLDNGGNRTAESIADPNGNLARSLSRSLDALNRVQQVSGATR